MNFTYTRNFTYDSVKNYNKNKIKKKNMTHCNTPPPSPRFEIKILVRV